MSIQRELCYGALFRALITQAATTNPAAAASLAAVNLTPYPTVINPAFAFADRRIAPAGSLPSSQYPTIMMRTAGELYEREMIDGPAKLTLISHVYIQTVIGQDDNVIPDVQSNNLADILEDLIETGAGQFAPGANKLAVDWDGIPGAIVFECRLTGRAVNNIAIRNQVFSEQAFEVSIISTH